MPCRVDLFPCSHCGGEHYYADECLNNPAKYGEGRVGYDPKTAVALGSKALARKDRETKAKRKRFNVEGALCDVLTLLEDRQMLKHVNVPQDILEWWEGHQSREQEKIKREALSKLSAKEKRALGLK
jgi:hypothetical protein